MPGKHNAGGCGCCGGTPSECWLCNQPTAIVVTFSGSCCDGSGTYLINATCDPTTTSPGKRSVSFGAINECNYCPFITTAGTSYEAECDSFDICEEAIAFLVISSRVSIAALFDEVAGIPRAQVWITHTISLLRSASSCVLAAGNTSYLSSSITFVDYYEHYFNDCGDIEGTPLTWVSRTRSFSHGPSVNDGIREWFEDANTDPDKFTYGNATENYTIDVCGPPIVSLVL